MHSYPFKNILAYATDSSSHSLVSFTNSQLGSKESVCNYSSNHLFLAGDFEAGHSNYMYVVDHGTNKLYRLQTNLCTLLFLSTLEVTGTVTGLVWSQHHHQMLVTHTDCATFFSVSSLSLPALTLTLLHTFTNTPEHTIITCPTGTAVDLTGKLYVLDAANSLVVINTMSWAVSVVGDMGFDTSGFVTHGMSFDNNTGLLYVAAHRASGGGLRVSDPLTGFSVATTQLGIDVGCLSFALSVTTAPDSSTLVLGASDHHHVTTSVSHLPCTSSSFPTTAASHLPLVAVALLSSIIGGICIFYLISHWPFPRFFR
eukprot:TRINITY_DN914_c0_g1_i7.p1 TRINITY_DN914_c0_g1~~TRINITY_DN914_c0_g1_i7.p1  ORF type:complete len:313 (+),score=76.55 TRINITY_DN914_c0_g1_i7:326-1264(+)